MAPCAQLQDYESEGDETVTIRKREKWSDVLGQPVDPLAPRTKWCDVWRQVETMRLEVRQGKGFMAERAQPEIITQTSTYGKFVDCRNPMCVRGGVNVSVMIADAVVKRQTSIDVTSPCCGYEGSPKGARRYGPCLFRFLVRGTITFKL
jgi:hypothetical protein